jgi:hypothetical protein
MVIDIDTDELRYLARSSEFPEGLQESFRVPSETIACTVDEDDVCARVIQLISADQGDVFGTQCKD